MVLFSMDFLKPYDPQKVWLRLSLENTDEGDTELIFNMINSIGYIGIPPPYTSVG